MKKTIKGKQCDTHTAKMIGRPVMIDEGRDIVEILYRTKSGNYFIHNVYKTSSIGKIEAAEKLYVVSPEDAQEWAKKWLSEVDYKNNFGNGDKDKLVSVTANISETAYRMLQKEKELTGENYGEIISYALEALNRG